MTKSTKRKEENKKKNDDVNDMSITDSKLDAVDDTDINMNDDNNIHGNNNNQSNERIEHGIQTTYGVRNGLRIINYCDEDRITLTTKKPIYSSYKDACMNNNITHRRDNITHAGNDNVTHAGTPPVSSE